MLLLPAVVVAQSCRKALPEPWSPFSVNYDVTALARETSWDSLPEFSASPVALTESSGAVACTWNPRAIWVIEDGGAGPMLYLIHTHSGKILAKLQLQTGWSNIDWEDLAHFTGPDGAPWLAIAEIGDNDAVHPSRAVYALPEPPATLDTTLNGIQPWTPPATKVWNYTYPDGPRDAESMFVDPVDGQLYLVSKRDFRNRIYRLPAQPSSTGLDTATFLGDTPLFMTTAADRRIMPSGRAPIVVRSYGRLYYWDAAANESAEEVLQRTPTQLPYTEQEAQGEIFAWLPDGSYVLLSEEAGGVAPYVQVYRRN
ncbi:MAG: hypothetical protein ACO3BA_07190 [Schleiferiaceae bacterium]